MNNCRKDSDFTIGTCKICGGTHMGRVTQGSDYARLDGMGISKVGDVVTADCGHTGVISTGSDYHSLDGAPVAYPGDMFTGDYTGQIIE